MKDWQRLEKQGVGAFSYEIWYNYQEKKYWIKIYIYGKVMELSGDYETLNRKLDEFSKMWNKMIDNLDFIQKTLDPRQERENLRKEETGFDLS